MKVNKFFQTEQEHVYAVGDVIGQPALASTSAEQGRLAARHALGLDCPSIDDELPIGIYTIPEIALVGKTEEQLTMEGAAYESGVARYKEIARGAIIGDDFGILKLLFDPGTRKVLGVHIFGNQASELLHIGQAVMQLGGTIDYFVETIFNYPTFAEAYKVAGLNGGQQAGPVGPMPRCGVLQWHYGLLPLAVEETPHVGACQRPRRRTPPHPDRAAPLGAVPRGPLRRRVFAVAGAAGTSTNRSSC